MKKTAKKILSLLLTACLLMGSIALMIPAAVVPATAEAATTVSVSINGAAATTESLPYDLPSNTNVTINGVTFRFDDNGHGSPSGATINADGTVRLRMKNGDMFWMPSVTVSNSSTIQTVTTLTGSNCGGSGSAVYQHSSRHGFGPTWNIRANDGVWSGSSVKANVASFRPVSDGGSSALSILEMAATETYGDVSTAGLVDVTASSSSVFGASIDANSGKWNETLVTTVSYDGGAKAVAQDVKGATLATATYASGSLTGAVGFILTWGKWASMYEYTLSDLSIKNATVHGSSKSIFSLYALFTGMEALPLHENVTVNGKTMRFDPLDTNIQSKWFAKDGAIRVKMFKGDMVIAVIDSDLDLLTASMDVTSLIVKDSIVNGEFSAGMAYNIEYSGNHYTSCALAQVSTAARRGIGRVYADGSNGGSYGTAISTSPGGNMVGISSADQNTTDFWYDENKAWVPGRTLRYSMAVGGEVVVSYGNTNGDVHTTARYTVGSGNASTPVGSFGFTGGWLDVYRTFEISNISYSIPVKYSYDLDFSTIGNMELQPGYNIVGGHALYYIRNSGSGRAYVSNGSLYLEGTNSDMILFDDLCVDGLAVTSEVKMTYLNDPGENGFLGYLHNLSEPFKNVNKNATWDFPTDTLVRTGSVSAVNFVKTVASLYKFSTAGNYSAPYQQYSNGATTTTNISQGSEFTLKTYTGVSGMGSGKIAFYAKVWANNYAHSAGYQKGVHGLVFSAGGAADSGVIKVKISTISIVAIAEEESITAYDGNALTTLPTGRSVNLNSSTNVYLSNSTTGKYTRALLNADGNLIVHMNPGSTFTATGLSGKMWTTLDAGNSDYPNNASITRSGNTLTCANAGATVLIQGYSLTSENKIYNGAASISTEGMIKLNFACDVNATMYSDAKLVARKGGAIIAEAYISNCYSSSAGKYVLSAPVNAKEMMDTVTFRAERNGSAISGSTTYSTTVKQYADALKASDSSWADLMNAMLQYGAAAQELFGYNTNNLPASTSGISINTSSLPSLTIDASCSSFISEVLGTLTLESGTDLNLYVLPKNTNTFTATASDGTNSVDVTVEKKYDAKNSSTYYWKITISDLKAEELGNEFYITVSDGTNSVMFTYSALCWVKSAINNSQSTAATKTLAKAIGVYASEAQKKNNVTVDSLAGMVAGAGAVSALRATTDSRITSIRDSSNDTSLVWTGKIKNYYVSSSSGSDSNSGVSSSKPWKTLAKVNAVLNEGSSTYKYNIYLKRGDTWRGEYLKTYKTSNVTITTYGSGAKPIIMGSPENGATASKWTEVATNIWRYAGSNNWADVGNIVFNNGESFGRKVVQLYVKNDKGTTLTDYTHPTAGAQSVAFSSYTDLKNDLDFYHDKNFEGGSGATGYLYLYSTSNPGSRFTSIEFSVNQHGIEIYKADNVRVDNICVKYVGGHGIAGNGLNLQNILVQNCEFGWIGGSIIDRIDASSIGTKGVFPDERYGNGVEIYGGCNNFRVQNNYIYQCFDAGITQQYNCRSATDSDHTANQIKINYNNNVIENCNYSIEYFLSDCPTGNSSYISNFNITNNIMWNAGKGFCETRVIWGRGFSAHVKAQSGTTSCNRFENATNAFVISGNKFIGERDAVFAICSKMSASNANANPVITNNEIYGIYKTNSIGAVCNYNSGSTVEIHNVYALFDKNIQTYMNGQIGSSKFSGNTIKFLVNFLIPDVRETDGTKMVYAVTDQDPLSYAVGDTVTFNCTLYAGDQVASCPWFEWVCNTEDGKNYSGVADGSTGQLTVKIPATGAGYVRLKVYVKDEQGNLISGVKQSTSYNDVTLFSALVNASTRTTAASEPSDFDSFWATEVAKVTAVDPDLLTMTKVDNPSKVNTLDGVSVNAANYDFYRVKIQTPEECGYAVGYLSIPKGAAANSLGITVVFNGYGVDDLTPYANPNYVVLNVCAHSIELGREASYYSNLSNSGGSLYNYCFKNNDSRDTCYFRTMILRDLQAVRFIKAYAGTAGVRINGSAKQSLGVWNGKLRVYGGSQGAFQGIAVAALDHDVTDAYWWIPWMCDVNGTTSVFRPSYTSALRYFDSVYFGKRIASNVNATITMGLGDYVSPPTGVFVLYNSMNCHVTLYAMQGMTHGYTPSKAAKTTYSK